MANEAAKPGSERGMRRWIKLIFALSLSLNFLIIAAVGAMAWRWNGHDDDRGRPGAQAFTLIRALPADRRAQLRTSFDHDRSRAQMSRREHADMLMSLLEDETFDAVAFEELIAMQHRDGGERMQRGAAALSSVISEMSDAERATYASEVKRLTERRRRRKH